MSGLFRFDWQAFDAITGLKVAIAALIVFGLMAVTGESWTATGLVLLFAWLTNVPGSLRERLGGMLAFAVGAIAITVLSGWIGLDTWSNTIAVVVIGFLASLALAWGTRAYMVGYALICWAIYGPFMIESTSVMNCVLAIRTGADKRGAPIPEVLHVRAINHELVIQPNPGSRSQLLDAEIVPLTEGLVGQDDWILAAGARAVVPETTGTLVGADFPLLLVRVIPDLNLRRSAEVDAAVGFGNSLVVDPEIDVTEVAVGRGVGAVTVIDQLAILDSPVLFEFFLLLGDLRFQRVFTLLFCIGSAVRIIAKPALEILAVEQSGESFGRGDRSGGRLGSRLRLRFGGDHCGFRGGLGNARAEHRIVFLAFRKEISQKIKNVILVERVDQSRGHHRDREGRMLLSSLRSTLVVSLGAYMLVLT